MQTPSSPRLLRIDASARLEGSFSRRLADAVQARWKAQYPHGRVECRDLVRVPVPHIEASTIEGYYTPPERLTPALHAATLLSDTLIAVGKFTTTDVLPGSVWIVPRVLPRTWTAIVMRSSFAIAGSKFGHGS